MNWIFIRTAADIFQKGLGRSFLVQADSTSVFCRFYGSFRN